MPDQNAKTLGYGPLLQYTGGQEYTDPETKKPILIVTEWMPVYIMNAGFTMPAAVIHA